MLVMVDTHSKRMEAVCTPNATFTAVIKELRKILARFGIPETVVTDNGTCFVSAEIETLFKDNGIMHLTSAPYHSASNGLTEYAEKGLRKLTHDTMLTCLTQVFLTYRLTPQSTTEVSPSELLLRNRPRS